MKERVSQDGAQSACLIARGRPQSFLQTCSISRSPSEGGAFVLNVFFFFYCGLRIRTQVANMFQVAKRASGSCASSPGRTTALYATPDHLGPQILALAPQRPCMPHPTDLNKNSARGQDKSHESMMNCSKYLVTQLWIADHSPRRVCEICAAEGSQSATADRATVQLGLTPGPAR